MHITVSIAKVKNIPLIAYSSLIRKEPTSVVVHEARLIRARESKNEMREDLVYLRMKRHNLLLALIFLICSYSAFGQRPTLALEPAAGGLMKLQASVAGHKGTFLFDSGSGVSSISPDFAALIGCQPWGQITGFRMSGDRLDMQRCNHLTFDFGTKSLPAQAVGVFDVSKYLPGEVGHVDGTIALDLFADQVFTLSYRRHSLQLLNDRDTSRRSPELRMPVHIVREAEGFALSVDLPVKTSAGTAWFEMDSGNTSPFVIVNDSLAALFQLPADAKRASIKVTLGDGSIFEGEARVRKLILDGNFGVSFLATHDVTVDVPHAAAWVDQSSGYEAYE